MNQDVLNKILEDHKAWLKDNTKGKCADLTDANLRDANLRDASLRYANLRNVDLTDADLRNADLRDADLREANLRGANLRGANLDFSAWALWCGTAYSNIKADKKLSAQLLYHACIIAQQHIKIPKIIIKFVKKYFHRLNEVKPLKED